MDTWVTVLVLVSSFSEGPEVKQLSEIAINGCVVVILCVNRKDMGVLLRDCFCWKEGFDKKIKRFS